MTHEKETECYLTNLIYRVYKPTLLVAHFHFSNRTKPNKNEKELPSQRTTTRHEKLHD